MLLIHRLVFCFGGLVVVLANQPCICFRALLAASLMVGLVISGAMSMASNVAVSLLGWFL